MDSTVKIWNLEGKLLHNLEGPSDEITVIFLNSVLIGTLKGMLYCHPQLMEVFGCGMDKMAKITECLPGMKRL